MNPKLKSQAVVLASKVHIATGSRAFPEEKSHNVWRQPHVFRFIKNNTVAPEIFVSETTRESSQRGTKIHLADFQKHGILSPTLPSGKLT